MVSTKNVGTETMLAHLPARLKRLVTVSTRNVGTETVEPAHISAKFCRFAMVSTRNIGTKTGGTDKNTL